MFFERRKRRQKSQRGNAGGHTGIERWRRPVVLLLCIAMSPDVTTSFLKTFPSLSSKIIEIENILSPAFVRSRADEFDASDEMTGGVKLLSVGRFTHAKNYDNVPFIASQIIQAGIRNLKWYLIGYGDDSQIGRAHV